MTSDFATRKLPFIVAGTSHRAAGIPGPPAPDPEDGPGAPPAQSPEIGPPRPPCAGLLISTHSGRARSRSAAPARRRLTPRATAPAAAGDSGPRTPAASR